MLEQKRQDAALEIYTEALTKNPNDFPVLKQLGVLLFVRGEFRPALEVMTQALTLWPRDEHLPDSIAHAAMAVGSGDDTIKQLQDLLEVSPDLPKVRNALSQLLIGKKEYDEAVAILREGVKLSPERRDLINNLAFLLISNPDPSKNLPIEAAVMLERICYETGYGDPRYLHTLSLVYSVVGRMEEAISVATKAHQIAASSEKPEFSQLLPSIGMSLERYKIAQGTRVSRRRRTRRDEPGGGREWS